MNYIRALKDKSARHIMLGIAIFAMLFLVVIGIGLFLKALPIIKEKGIWVLLTSGNWRPFKGEFGFLPYILSTLYVSLLAIAIALPLSLLTSIYLNTYASKNLRRFFQPFIDVLVGHTISNLWCVGHTHHCAADCQ